MGSRHFGGCASSQPGLLHTESVHTDLQSLGGCEVVSLAPSSIESEGAEFCSAFIGLGGPDGEGVAKVASKKGILKS